MVGFIKLINYSPLHLKHVLRRDGGCAVKVHDRQDSREIMYGLEAGRRWEG